MPEAALLGLACIASTVIWHLAITHANVVETNGLLLVAAAAMVLAFAADRRWVRGFTAIIAVLSGLFGLLMGGLALATLLVGAEAADDQATGARLLCSAIATTAAAVAVGWLIPRTHD